jgi:DNA modification methylase
MVELDPKYVDVIIERWQNLTGEEAALERTGETFNSLKA